MEKQTGKNDTVSAFTHKKMCPKGAVLRSKDQTTTCHYGHAGCITNVDKLESLFKYKSVRDIGRKIADAGVTVAYCTTDGDLCLHRGVIHSTQEDNPSQQVKRLADLVNLSQTKVKRAKKRTFSPHLFPGMTTKKDRQECKCVLAADQKNGSSKGLKRISEQFNANTDQMKREMPPLLMLYFRSMVEIAVNVWKSQQEPVQGVTVTTGSLGLAHPPS